jgi:hypothetical protein
MADELAKLRKELAVARAIQAEAESDAADADR